MRSRAAAARHDGWPSERSASLARLTAAGFAIDARRRTHSPSAVEPLRRALGLAEPLVERRHRAGEAGIVVVEPDAHHARPDESERLRADEPASARATRCPRRRASRPSKSSTMPVQLEREERVAPRRPREVADRLLVRRKRLEAREEHDRRAARAAPRPPAQDRCPASTRSSTLPHEIGEDRETPVVGCAERGERHASALGDRLRASPHPTAARRRAPSAHRRSLSRGFGLAIQASLHLSHIQPATQRSERMLTRRKSKQLIVRYILRWLERYPTLDISYDILGA